MPAFSCEWSAVMSWSPTQYSKFEAERSCPVKDLVAQIPNKMVAQAADIGCGPGNSTEILQTRFADATIVGVDSSPEMMEAARKRLPTICFEVDDISTWRSPGPFDVILSNAALQWVPDHAALLPRLLAICTGGQSGRAGSRQSRRATASPDARAAPRVLDSRHGAEWYFRLLSEDGAIVNVWRTTYFHELSGGAAAIVEWFKQQPSPLSCAA
jgi:trans-aconitate 2-methyltransferase